MVLIVGATTVFAELQSALDRIWHVPDRAKPSGLWGILRARILSFGLILGLAFLLMVSLVVSAALAALSTWSVGLLPGWELLLQSLNTLVTLAILTLLFAMIFKFMPTTRVEWRDVWIGAAVTAVLFEIGKALIGLYLGKSGLADSFAGAGSLVLLLAWVYYAAQIFLLGAEFTKVYAQEHGSAAAKARPPQVVPDAEATQAPATPLPDYSGLTRAVEMQKEVDLRVTKGVSAVLPKIALLAVVSLLNLFADKRMKNLQKHRRERRSSARALKSGS